MGNPGVAPSSTFLLLFVSCLILSGNCQAQGQGQQGGRGLSLYETCDLPAEPGNCYAYVPSYYFDRNTGRCKDFVYGGCGGNQNRFQSIRECEQLRGLCLRRRNNAFGRK